MVDILMPQMGESIAEGTVTKWLKNVGDRVQRDEPLLEISTDKVDAEIPSPAAGVLREIKIAAGNTVPINSVLGVLADEAEGGARPPVPPPPAPAAAVPPPIVASPTPVSASDGDVSFPRLPPLPRPGWVPAPGALPRGADELHPDPTASAEDLRRTRSSPVVRRIAAEHQVDISQVPGTGISGRVTKQDILTHLDSHPEPNPSRPVPPVTPAPVVPPPPTAAPAPAPVMAPPTPSRPMPVAPPPMAPPSPSGPAPTPPAAPMAPPPAAVAASPAAPATPPAPPAVPRTPAAGRTQSVAMSLIRKKTAEHMTLSKRTSAHVTTVFEIDMSRVEKLRTEHRPAYEQRGVKLTYLPFILKAAVEALTVFPVLNASVDGDNIVYHKDVNIGLAVALDWGLIVPVIRNADEKNVLGLARAINDLAERARSKRLKVDEVQGGTFTVTNPGVFGGLFGTPIINQPQVGILGIGTIEKRPVVRDDAIAIRTMAYVALSFDHRIVDGADADQFMAHLKKSLQEFDESKL
jgi:pyruvate dehydrogenase E2 component (dihydrolipoamide acetyltransferase)